MSEQEHAPLTEQTQATDANGEPIKIPVDADSVHTDQLLKPNCDKEDPKPKQGNNSILGIIGGAFAAISAILLIAAMAVNKLIELEERVFDGNYFVNNKAWIGWNELCLQIDDDDPLCIPFGGEGSDQGFLHAADAWFALNIIALLLYAVGAVVMLESRGWWCCGIESKLACLTQFMPFVLIGGAVCVAIALGAYYGKATDIGIWDASMSKNFGISGILDV